MPSNPPDDRKKYAALPSHNPRTRQLGHTIQGRVLAIALTHLNKLKQERQQLLIRSSPQRIDGESPDDLRLKLPFPPQELEGVRGVYRGLPGPLRQEAFHLGHLGFNAPVY